MKNSQNLPRAGVRVEFVP